MEKVLYHSLGSSTPPSPSADQVRGGLAFQFAAAVLTALADLVSVIHILVVQAQTRRVHQTRDLQIELGVAVFFVAGIVHGAFGVVDGGFLVEVGAEAVDAFAGEDAKDVALMFGEF